MASSSSSTSTSLSASETDPPFSIWRHPQKWRKALARPVDGASSTFLRWVFGLMMVWDLLYYVLDGRLERFYVNPLLLFKYPGFSWVEAASPGVLRALFWALVLIALASTLGLLYRLASILLFLGLTYIFFLDSTTYNNHNYLFCLLAFLFIFLPLNRTASIDAWRQPKLRSTTLPTWVLWLLRFQVGVPYFFGGIAKLNADWLVRAQPMRMWLETGNMGGSLKLDIFREVWVAYFFSWGGALLDLFIVPALLWRKTRIYAFAVITLFHLTNANLFNIGIFPWTMIFLTTIFFEPDWPRRFGLMRRAETRPDAGRKSKSSSKKKIAKSSKTVELKAISQPLALALAAYVLIQVLLPFRHWLYPGNVDWRDEAHRYAWRMKIRDKQGSVSFLMVNEGSRQSTVLEGSEDLLTRRQQRYLSQDPEVIRQFAHFLARRLREKGHANFEIRAVTQLSLNGREAQALIDPQVDLASQPMRFGPQPFILPLEAAKKRVE